MKQVNGKISQIIGPVVDVQFPADHLPRIHEAVVIERDDAHNLIAEVQQHLGENTVRCVAMESTDGLRRGMNVEAQGSPITMPVGEQVKGRLMNVCGEPIDGMEPMKRDGALPIHREAPKFDELTPAQEVLYTGIKVIDLIEPYAKMSPLDIDEANKAFKKVYDKAKDECDKMLELKLNEIEEGYQRYLSGDNDQINTPDAGDDDMEISHDAEVEALFN